MQMTLPSCCMTELTLALYAFNGRIKNTNSIYIQKHMCVAHLKLLNGENQWNLFRKMRQ